MILYLARATPGAVLQGPANWLSDGHADTRGLLAVVQR